MANDIITNLHPDNDPNTNLYPNIKKENIPNGSIDRNKLDDDVNSLLNSINELHPSGTDTSTNILAFTSNKGVYVATDNGHWYYWNGSVYTNGGVYQATAIADGSIVYSQFSEDLKKIVFSGDRSNHISSTPIAPYNDCDTLPRNSVVTYAIAVTSSTLAHKPDNFDNGTVLTFMCNGGNVGCQIAINRTGQSWIRTYYGSWSYTWSKFYTDSDSTNKLIYNLNRTFTNGSAVSPYNDFNTLPLNCVINYAEVTSDVVSNMPVSTFRGNVITYGVDIIKTQIAYTKSNNMYIRYLYGDSWGEWSLVALKDYVDMAISKIENPVYNLSVFESISVIGDSFASGLLVDPSIPVNVNKYSKSWIQILARKYGIAATNYSFNGATAYSWLNGGNYAGYIRFANDTAKDLYYICLGINEEPTEMGTLNDIKLDDYSQNANTFYGNMGKIISMIKEKSPNGKIIVCTIPFTTSGATTKNNAIKEIATYCGVPYIDTMSDSFFSSTDYTNFYTNHPTFIGYAGYANAYDRLTSKCISNNVSYFKYFEGV